MTKKQDKLTYNRLIIRSTVFLIITIVVFSSFLYCKLIEELDSEYSISSVQAEFPPWWEDEWEETITGFRIRGSSFDLNTLHTLQHWKGRFPFNDCVFFSFNYFTDADADSQNYEREIELMWRVKGNHYLSLFGYPYYDKEESDIGIRYSYEETPFDFVRLSLLFENAPNNYTFKEKDMDSMRIYTQFPIQFSLDISVIKKERNRLILSYNYGFPYRATYENEDAEILYKTDGESSNISIQYKYIFADSCEWGWGCNFLYSNKRYLSPIEQIDSLCSGIRLRRYFYLVEKSASPLHLFLKLNYDLEETIQLFTESVERSTFLIGIKTNFWQHSRVSLSYSRGIMNNISTNKVRRDNRLILSAEHKFRNKALVGMNLGIELDTRDTIHGYLGRYDKLFLFIQYFIK
ncbi:hypothetical protein KAU34_05250 [candidate division WOR-3 bacterium]|nr:hypothetical protein [candidate division WOR-3 bacterium]